MKNKLSNCRSAAIIFYLLSIVNLALGFYKKLVYSNPDGYGDAVNAYVGGDAYNYIINGTYAAGFFILAAGFMICGTLFVGIEIIATARIMSDKPITHEKNYVNEELPPL